MRNLVSFAIAFYSLLLAAISFGTEFIRSEGRHRNEEKKISRPTSFSNWTGVLECNEKKFLRSTDGMSYDVILLPPELRDFCTQESRIFVKISGSIDMASWSFLDNTIALRKSAYLGKAPPKKVKRESMHLHSRIR